MHFLDICCLWVFISCLGKLTELAFCALFSHWEFQCFFRLFICHTVLCFCIWQQQVSPTEASLRHRLVVVYFHRKFYRLLTVSLDCKVCVLLHFGSCTMHFTAVHVNAVRLHIAPCLSAVHSRRADRYYCYLGSPWPTCASAVILYIAYVEFIYMNSSAVSSSSTQFRHGFVFLAFFWPINLRAGSPQAGLLSCYI